MRAEAQCQFIDDFVSARFYFRGVLKTKSKEDTEKAKRCFSVSFNLPLCFPDKRVG